MTQATKSRTRTAWIKITAAIALTIAVVRAAGDSGETWSESFALAGLFALALLSIGWAMYRSQPKEGE